MNETSVVTPSANRARTGITVLVSQLFAPTTLHVSFQREGPGSFTQKEVEDIVERDASGKVLSLHFPEKTVVIANHQVRYSAPHYLYKRVLSTVVNHLDVR